MTVGQGRMISCLLAAIFFVAIAPTLRWLEFTAGSENLVVATAQEMHRGGPKLIPNLHGEKRLAKPPLAAWIAYLSISPQTVEQLSAPDPQVRERAFIKLGAQARWPALLAGAVMLIFVYEFTRLIRDPLTGVWSVMICATTLMLLRYGRSATTDIYIALFVAAANAAIALALIRGRHLLGFTLAGIALGLAMMSKGPVCIVLSVVPAAIFMFITRQRPKITPLLVGTALFAVIGFAWFVYAAATTPGVWALWYREVSRDGAREVVEGGNDWYAYLGIFPQMLPWLVMFIVGIIGSASSRYRQKIDDLLPLLLTFVPAIIMTFFSDRHVRYILPLVAPASTLAAMGLAAILLPGPGQVPLMRNLRRLHWCILLVMSAGLFVLLGVADASLGGKLIPLNLAISLGVVALALLGIAFFLERQHLHVLPVATFAIMLAIQAPAVWGYSRTPRADADMRDFAELIITHHPTARVYNLRNDRKRPPTDLGVYLNRVVRTIPTVSEIEPGAGPVIAILQSRKKDADPLPPEGFRFLGKILRDEKTWHWAFVRDDAGN